MIEIDISNKKGKQIKEVISAKELVKSEYQFKSLI
jgi:hypothetical protein